ncbi:MAG: ABC transporter permease [Clostridium sp.]|uniref:ABC transporter permease n=1 Tax=Clostridium sp. TaxID=1506 RepID=UPI003F2A7915
MRVSDNISLAFKDLGRRKKRTFLTSFGITLGAILIILMVSLGLILNQFLVSTVNSGSNTKTITVNPVKADAKMPTNPKEAIKDMPDWMKKNFDLIDNEAVLKMSKLNGVDGVEAYIGASVAQILRDGKTYYSNFSIKGYNLNYDMYFNSDVENAKVSSKDNNFKPIIEGKTLQKGERNEVLVGQSILESLGITNPKEIVGQNITIDITNINGAFVKPYKKTFKVVGVISKFMPDGNKIVMNSTDVEKIAGFMQYTSNFFKEYGYNGVVVEAKNLNDVNSIVQGINNIGYFAQSTGDKTAQINKSFNTITLVLSILGIIVIIVAGIGIVNTMIMAVHEKKKSIGIMKSVGASNSEIKTMFIFQAGAIGLVGSVIGAIISSILFRIISAAIIDGLAKKGNSVELMKFAPWWLILGTIVFSIIVSVIAGIYPSSKASKLDPIEALRE